MPKVDLASIEKVQKTGYPPPHRRTGPRPLGATPGPGVRPDRFGANVATLEPGAWSSQRHWHEGEDEMVVMLGGEAVLVEDEGETSLRPGDIAAWPKGIANGHHLINRSDQPCTLRRDRRRPSAGGALFGHRHDRSRADGTLRPQGRDALRRHGACLGAASSNSYCSITHGSSWAFSIHSTTWRVRQHRFHIARRRAGPARRR